MTRRLFLESETYQIAGHPVSFEYTANFNWHTGGDIEVEILSAKVDQVDQVDGMSFREDEIPPLLMKEFEKDAREYAEEHADLIEDYYWEAAKNADPMPEDK